LYALSKTLIERVPELAYELQNNLAAFEKEEPARDRDARQVWNVWLELRELEARSGKASTTH